MKLIREVPQRRAPRPTRESIASVALCALVGVVSFVTVDRAATLIEGWLDSTPPVVDCMRTTDLLEITACMIAMERRP